MTEPKPLTYDEPKVASAAFRTDLPNAWIDSRQGVDVRLSAAMTKRSATVSNLIANRELEETGRQSGEYLFA